MHHKLGVVFQSIFKNLIVIFFLLSCIIYFIHYLIFQDYYYIFKILIAQLGFLPISTLLVTLVLNKFLSVRQEKERMNKLNMVIGTFFSEMGNELLRKAVRSQECLKGKQKEYYITNNWKKQDFVNLKKVVQEQSFQCHFDIDGMKNMKEFLINKREFMLQLLQNPSLLEHQSFTELLQAVFHLAEECIHRNDMDSLCSEDFKHLEGDLSRVYQSLILEWIQYLQHLQSDYPYLFSLAIRMNPWNE